MIIFKTYEGFFDFLRKKKEEKLEETPISIKVRNFLETEDRKSIEEIFETEGIEEIKFLCLQIGSLMVNNILPIPDNFGTIFNEIKFFSKGKEYDVIERIKKSSETTVRFVVVISTKSGREKVKDVSDLIQSLFDFEKYEIFDKDSNDVEVLSSGYVIKFTF